MRHPRIALLSTHAIDDGLTGRASNDAVEVDHRKYCTVLAKGDCYWLVSINTLDHERRTPVFFSSKLHGLAAPLQHDGPGRGPISPLDLNNRERPCRFYISNTFCIDNPSFSKKRGKPNLCQGAVLSLIVDNNYCHRIGLGIVVPTKEICTQSACAGRTRLSPRSNGSMPSQKERYSPDRHCPAIVDAESQLFERKRIEVG